MPQLTIDADRLVDGAPLAGVRFTIDAWPSAASAGGRVLLGGARVSGTLDENGQASVELPESPEGTWLVFSIPQYNTGWPFTMPSTAAVLGERTAMFGTPPQPVGPVPGPQGPPGPAGADGLGSHWFEGSGAPTATDPAGPRSNDFYLDAANNDIYEFDGTSWNRVGNLTGGAGEQGPKGDPGDPGQQGPKGDAGTPGRRGSVWYSGTADPPAPAGSLLLDKYYQTDDGDVWE
ncbi:MAG: collagen-like protein, partial [Chloroflexi bacterium]|nr:collagen-like protein [Chloroflexota bacterium]